MTSSASQINSNDLDALYNDLYAHRTDPTYIPAGYDLNGRSLKSRLQKLLPDLNMSAYGCILLAYAYHMRCKFLHGNETPPLFLNIKKENEDISAFRMLNLFLERFLKAEIPQMFSTSWMDQTKCDAITNFLTSNDYTNFNANT